jgi:type IV secretory pathway TrbD component
MHSDIEESADTKPFKHFLNSALGGIFVILTPLLIHSVIIYFYTDIGITEFAPCNLKDGYPGQGEIGFTSGIIIISTSIIYLLQNRAVMSIILFQLEFWLIITNTFVLLVMWFATFVVLKVVASSDPWFTTNFAYISFVVLIATNVFIECVLPLLYYLFRFKPRSAVTDEIRAKFSLCHKQAKALEKLVDHASTELETESILLYQAIRTLRSNRANVLSSNFESCLRLATLIFEKYIQGEYKTLKWYDLRYITSRVSKPIELLEKESVLEELETAVREKIVLPMYARMEAKQKPSY